MSSQIWILSPKKILGINQQILNCLHHQKPWEVAMEGVELVELFPYPKNQGLTESADCKKVSDLSSSLLSMRFCIIGIVTLPIFSPLKMAPGFSVLGPWVSKICDFFFPCEKQNVCDISHVHSGKKIPQNDSNRCRYLYTVDYSGIS